MKLRLSIIFLFFVVLSNSQEKFTISGTLTDQSNGESLIGATIQISGTGKGTATNTYGFYSLTLPAGKHKLQYSFVGYQSIYKEIDLKENVVINIELPLETEIIQEVEVRAEAEDGNVRDANIGQVSLEIEKIKTLPAFLGEVDVVKTLQLLPGVSSTNEGSQGFYVRGGGPDQNMVLLDEAVVYNASHLFGFFSVFNSDAVKNVNLTKGGIPAKFGGRLASVLEVNMNEGNNKRWGVKGGLGLISSRLTVEGPLKKDKGSIIISGRRTYIDILMKPFIPKSSPFHGSSYFFYDLNLKMNYRVSDKDKIYISGYYGKDVFRFVDSDAGFDVKMPWGNGIGAFRWNHSFNGKLFMNLSATYSNYQFSFESEQDGFNLKLLSRNQDIGGKIDFTYIPNYRHRIEAGAHYTYHIFQPQNVSANQDTIVFETGEVQKYLSHEVAFYIQDEIDITEWFRANIGLRYSQYYFTGSFNRYVKNGIGFQDSIKTYQPNELIRFYHGLEPRLSMRFLLNKWSSIKAGFNYNYQYVHLASLSSVSLPTDTWFLTTDKAPPQKGWQASLGYFFNFWKNNFEASVEVYYKDMRNLVEYAPGTLPEDNLNDNVDNLLIFGRGYSVGAEFFLKKVKGKFTGWIGYTLAWTNRIFDEINNGNPYPAKYDRRHDLSVVLSYQISPQWNISSTFIYATGNTMTMPQGWYLHEGNVLYEYGDYNQTRMDPYHRLDVAFTWFDKPFRFKRNKETGEKEKVKRKLRNSVTVSVYNLYNRANPYFLYFDSEGDPLSGNGGDFTIKAKQVSLFPILPSVTWNFKF
ncbi:MAG: TonB-dependent receptor [Crocinitomicaceae bacterium]